jgi:5-methylcytosine-specific restriction endonuclease McrA
MPRFAQPCLTCGRPTRDGSRCADCSAARGNPYGHQWEKLVKRVIARDGGICWACGKPGATSGHHLKSVAWYGTGLPAEDDVVATHVGCNARLGSPL